MNNTVLFSVKYRDPGYPATEWAADWGWGKKRGWSISQYASGETSWWPVNDELDELAYRAILDKFGLSEYKNEYPLRLVEKMSPAQLALERRKKERRHGLAHLEITSDNIDVKAGKGRIPHYAEDYK